MNSGTAPWPTSTTKPSPIWASPGTGTPGHTRGLEATPIVVYGVVFTTGTWSRVYANDGRTGELNWRYDPEVPRAWGKYACCDVVNRGVAVW